MISLVELRTINEDNFKECLSLNTSVVNQDFVDPVVYSLAEAWLFYQDTRPFAIYENDVMIGFVSMYVGEAHYQIVNFLIADTFRGKGLGIEAAKACIAYLESEFNASRVSVPVEIENVAAQKFWEKLGFRFSDNVEDGYVFMRRDLSMRRR